MGFLEFAANCVLGLAKSMGQAQEEANKTYERYYPRYASMDREELLRERKNISGSLGHRTGQMKAWKEVCKERGYIRDNED